MPETHRARNHIQAAEDYLHHAGQQAIVHDQEEKMLQSMAFAICHSLLAIARSLRNSPED